jgi:hypothetical protein
MSPTNHRRVRRACGTEISDRQLDRLTVLAHNARDGDVTEGEAEYLIASAGPLLEELAERRRIDAYLASLFEAANVIPLRGEVS